MTLTATVTKLCRGCGKTLPVSAFYPSEDVWTSRCRECCKEASRRAYHGLTPKKLRPWKPAAAKPVLVLTERQRRINREDHLLRVYGLTQADYDLLLLKQNGKCAICSVEKALVVDHDHQTKIVRGLLCGECNRGLGLLRDNTELLFSAICYLSNQAPVIEE